MNEAVYGYHMLASSIIDNNLPGCEITSLYDLPFDYNLFHNYLKSPITINGQVYSYGLCLLNKFIGVEDIQVNSKTNLQDLSKLIHNLSSDDFDYHYRVCELNRKLNWLVASHPSKNLTIPIEESLDILDNYQFDNILNNLPENPYIGAHLYNAKLDEAFKHLDPESNISNMLWAKNKLMQFSRSIVSIGYVADECNIVNSVPIKSNLLGGLNEDDFFLSTMGSRKGIVD
jgi:hypothetical protein